MSDTTARMLLLLLGIIVLHVTVLVLLFVSTIVSVSTAPRHREGRKLFVLFAVPFPAQLSAGEVYFLMTALLAVGF